ncbi:endolytic transglycosylase MltG [Hydrogenoanaerobacterium sp.]|uniref:endolytic transglycosylase MltG n=1 Tax=Hydrogenoanaerobacterium sp. TaxID=2953763 RepID=UPI00289B00ED|nr:endolytic transglycosylase MltG [Hydrogenoanaerobacterium sp.]
MDFSDKEHNEKQGFEANRLNNAPEQPNRFDDDSGELLSAPRQQSSNRQPPHRPAQHRAPQPANKQNGRPKRAKPPKPKKKYRVARALLITIVLVGLGAFLAFFALQSASDLLGLAQEDNTITINIPEGSGTGDIAKILNEKGVIDTPITFRLYSKLKKADGKYQFGEYILNSNMSYDQIIIALKSGNDRQDVVKISFPEGLSLWEVGKKLEENEVCTAQAFVNALQKQAFEYDFMGDIPVNAPLRFYKYEGYVFPNTYDFFVGENPVSVAKKFFNSFNANITAEMYDRMKELGMTLDETITLASIIQKEASYPADMNAVSGVFHNRFAQADTYPQMQSDVTIFYVEKFIKPHLTTANQEMYDAYNTYKCVGLPVGPICNPGIDAIKAALYPDENDYYYFLTDKEGKFYYAKTMAEHEQNIYTASKVGGVNGIATD